MGEALKLTPYELEIEIISGPHLGQKFNFKGKSLITVGRGQENDIVLSNDPKTSRFHAEIKFSDGNYYVYNLSNKNFILINGLKEDQALIEDDTTLTAGDTELKISALKEGTLELPEPLSIQFKNPLQPIPNTTSPLKLTPPIHLTSPSPIKSEPLPRPHLQKSNKKKSGNELYLILFGVAVLIGIILLIPKKNAEEVPTNNGIITPLLQDEVRFKKSMEELEKAKELKKNKDSRKSMAKQFFVSGMREYNNGQYHKAIEFLASAFQSDPSLEDAAKYHLKSKQNLDRLIDFNFSEGKKYRESNNYRMCKAAFQNVLLYIKNNMKHSRYKEAKQFYDECASLDELGRQ